MAVLPFGIGPMELALVLAVVLLLFGPKRLPQLGKSLGKTVRSIREGVEGKLDEDEDAEEGKSSAKAEAKKSEAEDKDSEEKS